METDPSLPIALLCLIFLCIILFFIRENRRKRLAINRMLPRFIRFFFLSKYYVRVTVHQREQSISEYLKGKDLRKRLQEELVHFFRAEGQDDIRSLAMESLLFLDSTDGLGEDISAHINMAMRDNSPQVRKYAITRLVRDKSMVALDIMEEHLAIEDDLENQKVLLDSILKLKKRKLANFIKKERFDDAEITARQLLSIRPDDLSTKDIFSHIQFLRQRKIDLEIEEKNRQDREEAVRLTASATKKLGEDDCDGAESLAKKALTFDPTYQKALNILDKLPQIRKRFDEALKARNQSNKIRKIEELRVNAEKLLNEHDFGVATKRLLTLSALKPEDTWASDALKKLPELEKEKRVVEKEDLENQRLNLIRQTRVAVEQEIKKGQLEEAEQHARLLISLDPDRQQFTDLLARVKEMSEAEKRKRRCDEALAEVKKVLTQNKLNEAEEKLRELLSEGQDDNRIKSLLEQINYFRKQQEESEARSREEEKRSAIQSLRDKVDKAFQEHNYVEAVLKAEKLFTGDPKDPEHSLLLEKARAALKESEQSEKENYFYQEIEAALQANDFDKAEQNLKSFLNISPSHVRALDLLNRLPDIIEKTHAVQKANQDLKGRQEYDKIVRKAANLFEKGEFSQTASILRRAIALDPNDDRSFNLLKRCFEVETITRYQPHPQKTTRFNSYGEIEE